MTEPKPSLAEFATPRRRALTISSPAWNAEPLSGGNTTPLMLTPSGGQRDLLTLAQSGRETLLGMLATSGALLFRGFNALAVSEFQQFIMAISGSPIEYRERSSPRRKVGNRIYTSTDYPADQRILFHNENAYAHTWPLKIFFLCVEPPTSGGETPIADCRRVLERIPVDIRRRFELSGVMYVRNFGDGLGLDWQDVFQTTDRFELEGECRVRGYQLEWKDATRLRTRRVGAAVARHPSMGQHVWFNHAAFFHSSGLPPLIRESLLREFAEEDLPNNTFYGDGSPISAATIAAVQEAYALEAVRFAWQRHDLLMVDNMLFAHGREPYVGARQIVVGMSEPFETKMSREAAPQMHVE